MPLPFIFGALLGKAAAGAASKVIAGKAAATHVSAKGAAHHASSMLARAGRTLEDKAVDKLKDKVKDTVIETAKDKLAARKDARESDGKTGA